MKRVSNLAFNKEFPAKVAPLGLTGIPRQNKVRIARDVGNPYDKDAVGVWLLGIPDLPDDLPLGWLYRKDKNREPVLAKLDRGEAIEGHVEAVDDKKVVVFWL
jgi:hypothetical protein